MTLMYFDEKERYIIFWITNIYIYIYIYIYIPQKYKQIQIMNRRTVLKPNNIKVKGSPTVKQESPLGKTKLEKEISD